MSQDTQDFEQLRRLLALKRHEQPPPGYFNDFSRQVIVRIKAGERGEAGNLIERLLWEAPWLQRLFSALETRPILSGACGVAVCGLLITGVLYSDNPDVSTVALVPVAEASVPGALTGLTPADQQPFMGIPAVAIEPSGIRPAFAGAQGNNSLLGDIQGLKAERASYTFPVRN